MANFHLADDVIDSTHWTLKSSAEGDSSVTHSATGSAETYHYFLSTTDIPNNADWETGGFTVYLTVDTGAASMLLAVRVDRCNSAGVKQESSAISDQTDGLAGNKVFTIASKNWSAGNSTDRIQLLVIYHNDSMTTANITLSTGSATGDYFPSSITITSAQTGFSIDPKLIKFARV